MPIYSDTDPTRLIGAEYDRLSYEERSALSGKWIALPLYTPRTQPLRVMEAIGDSVTDCARQLQASGKDVTRYEYSRLNPPR